jgi:hypothetical protein
MFASPREIPTPCEGIEQRQDDEEAKQKRIKSIIARALAFIRNGQKKEALRELAKEELKDISEVKTKKDRSVRPDGQAFNSLWPRRTSCCQRGPTMPHVF